MFAAVTYALFTDGIGEFQKCYEEGIIDKIFATNLTYRRPELSEAPWFVEVDMSKYIAKLIDALNYDDIAWRSCKSRAANHESDLQTKLRRENIRGNRRIKWEDLERCRRISD